MNNAWQKMRSPGEGIDALLRMGKGDIDRREQENARHGDGIAVMRGAARQREAVRRDMSFSERRSVVQAA